MEGDLERRKGDEPDKTGLLTTLDWEIGRLDRKSERPDSTYWVLVAAFASCVWLFIETLKKTAYTWAEIGWLFLLGSLLFDIARHTYRSVLPDESTEGRPSNRFFYTLKAGNNRPVIILVLCRCCLLLGIVSHVAESPWFVSLVAAWLYYGGVFCIFLGGYILTHCRVPVCSHSSAEGWFYKILSAISYLISLLALVGFSLGYHRAFPSLDLTHLQAAALLVASVYVMMKMVRGRHPNPLLDSLVEIRRDLALGELDYATAHNKTELAILGLRVEDVLQREIADFLFTLNTISEKCTTFESSVRALDELIKDLATGTAPDGAERLRKKSYIRALTESCATNKTNLQELMKIGNAQSDRLVKRVRLVRKASPAARADIERIQANIKDNIAKCDESSKRLQRSVEELLTRAKDATITVPEVKEIHAALIGE